MEFDIKKVNRFWAWFASVSKELLDNPTDPSLISQIDSRVRSIGSFDWEIGPWGNSLFYFAISPGLNIEKLTITRSVVDLALDCAGWQFLPSKPPKEWNGIWKMNNEMGKEIWIDCNNWKYILYQFDDGTFDADILTDVIEGDENTLNTAVDIALTGYLGEETFMSLIMNINIVEEFGEENDIKPNLLKHIKKHMESIM
jgi:hypothetical protein